MTTLTMTGARRAAVSTVSGPTHFDRQKILVWLACLAFCVTFRVTAAWLLFA